MGSWLYKILRLTVQVGACRIPPDTFPTIVSLMPADIKSLSLACEDIYRGRPNLAPLTRLAKLEDLTLYCSIVKPIPQLPALHRLYVETSDLQLLSPAAAALESLQLRADRIDFGQPYTLVHFTRLTSLYVSAESIDNFKPEVLPSTLRDISLGYEMGVCDEDPRPVFPVGGTMSFVEKRVDNPATIEWRSLVLV